MRWCCTCRRYTKPRDNGDTYPVCGECTVPPWTIFHDILTERARQNTKWGEQNHPDGTGGWRAFLTIEKEACEEAARLGCVTWRHILAEEVEEAFAEEDAARLRTELIQIAGVALQWVEAIDRREASKENQ
jgi:hypothetical protein